MKDVLIVGLGNPGPNYDKTRHNAGQWLVDELAKQEHCSWHLENKFKSQIASFRYDNAQVILAKPTTFMNLSGQSVFALSRFYKIPPEQLIVAHDELDFAPGQLKIKWSGGHGGHNGLRDIISHISTPDFLRIRIGIGHPGVGRDVAGYVLHAPPEAEKALINKAMARVFDHTPLLYGAVREGLMSALNTSC